MFWDNKKLINEGNLSLSNPGAEDHYVVSTELLGGYVACGEKMPGAILSIIIIMHYTMLVLLYLIYSIVLYSIVQYNNYWPTEKKSGR